MNSSKITKIEYVDVIIVGGGIAGIATAEFLARHSNLSIKLLDKASHLGTESSGKLEGWYHTGALYSGQDDAQTFINCVNGVEDLINFYTPYFTSQCNVELLEKKAGFFTPSVIPKLGGWFDNSPVYLIHPQVDSPEIHFSRLKSDLIHINNQKERVLGRLEAAYGEQHNWLIDNKCIAPTYAQVENNEKIESSLQQSTTTIRNICNQFNLSYGIKTNGYGYIKTLDCSMNTNKILKDLVSSSLNHGVNFETGITIEKLSMDNYGPVRLKSLLCKTKEGLSKKFKARLFIFAVGNGFEPFLRDLQIRARLKCNKSAMVVAVPPLTDVNFFRMSTKNNFHFNHFLRRSDPNSHAYSILANSGYINNETSDENNTDPILELAERYFGDKNLYSRELYSYECAKTEFVSEEEQKRRYSYWIESKPNSNYICILPGKFSFFPTVAYQTYQRVKTLLDFQEINPRLQFQSTNDLEIKTNGLVANSFSFQISENSYLYNIK